MNFYPNYCILYAKVLCLCMVMVKNKIAGKTTKKWCVKPDLTKILYLGEKIALLVSI